MAPHMEYLPGIWFCPHCSKQWGVCASRGGKGVGCVHLGDYLSMSPGLSCSIWSHTYCSWYFSRFLFKDGSLALMYMASFMCLVVPWVYVWTMLKQSGLTACPVELVCSWMGEGTLRCSSNLSSKDSDSWGLGICIGICLHFFVT